MGPPLRSCAEMSKQRQKQTALLLIAILAMLPLHGIQAALASLAHSPGDTHSPAEHVMHDAAGMHACKMHQQNMADTPSGHQCDSSGCDMCGTCAADLPSLPSLLLSHEHLLPEPGDRVQPLRSQSYPLFRPPRA